jgi:gamma-glutamyl hercynylcysteine S-oxide synthase
MIETVGELDLADALRDARARTLAYVADLSEEQLQLPLLDTVNPMLWELGHVGYFAEFWTLRQLHHREPILPNADRLYDSAKIAHDDRWHLPLPGRAGTLEFLDRQLRDVLERLDPGSPAASSYLHRLALHHEDMHGEAVVYTRQTLSYPKPQLRYCTRRRAAALAGDARVPGGTYRIGARPDDPFVFDNEKWEHEVELMPFAIARAAVTNAEFLQFVESGGYGNRTLWPDAGWAWREPARAEHPLYWRRTDRGWERRHFDAWQQLEPHEPVVHVNFYEAQAYCAYAGRRLPTEAEWEVAATGGTRRRYPWGEEPPDPERTNLDAWYGDVVDVGAFENGDSPFGVRQMLGNVWEWTSTPFGPYPGFSPDAYREYSEPWFGDHTVLRGGAWTTRARMITTRWRNFYRPIRRDIITGFRTCAI